MHTQDELDKLLKKWRAARGKTIRKFLGNDDVQRITLYGVFPQSNITLTSPVDYHKPWPDVVLQGPEFQLNFLYEYLRKLIGVGSANGSVCWNGILRQTSDRIDLTCARDEKDPISLLELMEYRFRCDAMIYSKLKLSEVSILEIVYEEKKLFREPISLPGDIINGDIELPIIEFLQ